MADHGKHDTEEYQTVDPVSGMMFADDVPEADVEMPDAEERLQLLVQRAAEEAVLWRDEDLDEDQAEATDYYMGRPFGNETEGRSRVVSTDVRDTIQAMLPSLMRIFFGSEKIVEYQPFGPEDVEFADQATDMANYIIRNDNNGFLQIHGWMKDAMIRRLGAMKVWSEAKDAVEGTRYTGLTEQMMIGLQGEEGVEIEIEEEYSVPFEGAPTGMMTVYDVNAVRRSKERRVKFACIPPEEFIFSPDARELETAEMVGHVRAVPASELISMGIDPELVEEHKGRIPYTQTGDDLASERKFDQDQREALVDEKDEARESVWYGEIYVYADMSEDQSGEASLIEVTTIGENYELVEWEYCKHRPFALLECDPEPHTMIGLSVADYVKDIQLIKSNIIRGQLDSLTLSLNPRTEVVEGEVNMGDVMNHEVGGIIRVEKPGMVREVVHSFIGKEAFPMLQYMDEQKENRTGISKAAAGLDADALQSSTKAAVAATLSGAQQHIEMLARIFAETGFRQLYRLILKEMTENPDIGRMVRLRNDWVEIDPSKWNPEMDVIINLALGAGSTDEKLQVLQLIAQEQGGQLQAGSPLVSNIEYRNTLGRITELAGFPNSNEFWKPFGEEEEKAYQEQQAQQQQQDPTMMIAEASIKLEQQKLELDAHEVMLKDERERLKMQFDFAIKQATAEAQYGTEISNQEIQADMQAAKAVIDADAKARQMAQQQQAQQQQAQQAQQPAQGGMSGGQAPVNSGGGGGL